MKHLPFGDRYYLTHRAFVTIQLQRLIPDIWYANRFVRIPGRKIQVCQHLLEDKNQPKASVSTRAGSWGNIIMGLLRKLPIAGLLKTQRTWNTVRFYCLNRVNIWWTAVSMQDLWVFYWLILFCGVNCYHLKEIYLFLYFHRSNDSLVVIIEGLRPAL